MKENNKCIVCAFPNYTLDIFLFLCIKRLKKVHITALETTRGKNIKVLQLLCVFWLNILNLCDRFNVNKCSNQYVKRLTVNCIHVME